MRLVLPIVLLLLGLGGGVGVGIFLGSGDAEVAATDEDVPTPDDAAEGEGEEDTASAGGGALVTPANAGTEYVRLRNQFIVPVVRHGSVRSLVILVLTVEATTGGSDAVFQHEPRLRDSFLRVLFAHANAGGFDGQFTESVAMAPLRAGLRDAAVSVLGDVARDVLIVDITRQDA
jgi:flagellar FliL protein